MNKEKYQRYLCSAEWWDRRNAAIQRARGRCENCGSIASHVHHLTYIRIYAELPDDLMALCEQCHTDVHAGTLKNLQRNYSSVSRQSSSSSELSPIDTEAALLCIALPYAREQLLPFVDSILTERGKVLFEDVANHIESADYKATLEHMQQTAPFVKNSAEERLGIMVGRLKERDKECKRQMQLKALEDNGLTDEAEVAMLSEFISLSRTSQGLEDSE